MEEGNRRREKKFKEEENILPYISTDLIYDNILHRVQAQTLFNGFRIGCKLWYEQISEPLLIEKHLLHCKPGLIIEKTREGEPDFVTQIIEITDDGNFMVQSSRSSRILRVQSSYNGLVLLHDVMNEPFLVEYHIINLVTMKWEKLPFFMPGIGIKSIKSGLAFDSSIKKYKVASIFMGYDLHIECRILTLGTSRSDELGYDHGKWREVEVPHVETKSARVNASPISINGVFYWDFKAEDYIGSMEVSTEKFQWIHLPEITIRSGNIVDLGGSLALVHNGAPGQIDVWVLNDSEKSKWRRRHIIILPLPLEGYIYDYVYPLVVLKNGEVIYFQERNGILFLAYDIKRRQLKLLDVKSQWELVTFCSPHVDSLVSWK